ncbi:hypothetical protein QTP70_032720, partial [Hemibagrus guttatus]
MKADFRIVIGFIVHLSALICCHTEKFPVALTIVEDGNDFNKAEDAQDPKDLDVFDPSPKWQTLKPGQTVTAGSHVRLNLQTGQREVKLGVDEYLPGRKSCVSKKKMAILEELRKEFAEMQRRLAEQAGALDQARTEQREALSLAKAVMEQQASTRAPPATIYIPRDHKLTDFTGATKPGEEIVEEWIVSIKSAFRVMKVPEEDQVELIKQHLKGEARVMVKFMSEEGDDSVESIFKLLQETCGDKVPIGSKLKDFYDQKQAPESNPDAEEMRGLDGIVGMNVLRELKNLCPFLLTTDGSHNGLGAILGKKQGSVECVIAYASCGLKGSERNDRIPWGIEQEQEDTEKDFIWLTSDEVPACLWTSKGEEGDEATVRVAKQALIRKGVDGYSWSSISEQQRKDPCIAAVYDTVLENRSTQVMSNKQTPLFTSRELKQALKKFKGVDDTMKRNSEQGKESSRAVVRSMDELRRDLAMSDLLLETDVQIMSKLLSKFSSTNTTIDQRVAALLDLEYLVHQVDNAHNLVLMGGIQLVNDALNNTDFRLQESAAFVLGSAVSSNPTVQDGALESGTLQKLLAMLATPRPVSVKKKVLFALACLLRHFPPAQSQFVKLGGLQLLVELFQAQGAELLRVRIITLLYDLITEQDMISQTTIDPPFIHQEHFQQYSDIPLFPMLVEQGWCSLVPEILACPNHDWREKTLQALLALMPHCQTLYLQNPTLSTSLGHLQQQYQELALRERSLGEDNGYF